MSGGPGTLKTIIATLEKKRPVVVYADSGGAAEAIYKYIHFGELPKLSGTNMLRTCLPEISPNLPPPPPTGLAALRPDPSFLSLPPSLPPFLFSSRSPSPFGTIRPGV